MTRRTTAAWLTGIGLLGPGLADWPAARAVLRGEATYTPRATELPAPELLPAAERRRAAAPIRLTIATGLAAAQAAGLDPARLATVFASSGADGRNCHEICQALAGDDRLISPTRFHNSVHNAASGYWGIATGAMAPANVVCAFDASFAAGLLDALVQVQTFAEPVLLLAHDSPYPEPLHAARPLPDHFAVALALCPTPSAAPLARLCLLDPDATTADTRLAVPELEALRRTIPAARALPLLHAVAHGVAGTLGMAANAGTTLRIGIAPC
jgi:hypothetical protein